MRIKSWHLGRFGYRVATEDVSAEELAQAARDTLSFSAKIGRRPEHLLLLGNLYATLAVYELLCSQVYEDERPENAETPRFD